MRTTLDLPEKLLTEVMRVTHSTTKTKAIVTAMEEMIRKSKIAELKDFKGKVDLESEEYFQDRVDLTV